jgi:hypothetical protein
VGAAKKQNETPEDPASNSATAATMAPAIGWPWRWLVLIGLAQVLGLLSEKVTVHDSEELFNATAALELLHGHFDALFRLQYRPFCGGCTVASLLTAPLYALLEPSLFVYKLVPIGFYLGMNRFNEQKEREYEKSGAKYFHVVHHIIFIGL